MLKKLRFIYAIVVSIIFLISGILGVHVYTSCHSAGSWDMMFRRFDKPDNSNPPQQADDLTIKERLIYVC